MLYYKPSIQTTNVNGNTSGITLKAPTRKVTGIHFRKVKVGAADTLGGSKMARSNGGGAGASTASAEALPETIDKAKAKELAGDAFVEADFDAAAKDGVVSRDAFLIGFAISRLQKEGRLLQKRADDPVEATRAAIRA